MTPFGENLRKIRNERGMSQEEFASLLGTSKQVISRYETGQRSPKVTIVAEYAEKLGVDIGTLTGNALDAIRTAYGPDSPLSKKLRGIGEALGASPTDPGEAELVDLYRALNDKGRADMLRYARYLNADPDMKKDGASSDVTA